MKKKSLVFLSILLCSFFILSFTVTEKNETNTLSSPSVYPNNNIWDKFLFGAIHDEDADYLNNPTPYSHALQVGFNVAHGYNGAEWDAITQRHYPKGRIASDKLLSPVSAYAQAVRTDILQKVHDNGQRSMLMHRPKIEWLCYGKSSTYQCEGFAIL